jgi:RimJ/RimL family protein N-acetyltransferase
MSHLPTLYTPRLILRPFTLADAPRVRELAGDRRVAATTALIPHPYPDGAAEAWIGAHEKSAAQGTEFSFAITLAGTRTPGRENDLSDTGHVIGSIGVGVEGNPMHRRAALGYWIGVPYWNKGFATEAGRAILSFAFLRREYHRIFAWHFTGNGASGRVMQKLGLAYEGTYRQHFFKWDEFLDVSFYGLLRADWLARQRTSSLHKPRRTRESVEVYS